MKDGDTIFTRRVLALVLTPVFRGQVSYSVKDKKSESFALVLLGVATRGQPFNAEARLNQFGWHFAEAQTEVGPEVTEGRRRALFGEPVAEDADR